MTVKFKILGTCAGTGVPSFFCDCKGCQEARQNPDYARTRTGAFIDTGMERILIDANPDIRTQMVRESINGVDVIFLTHWHADHYGGLGEFEYYVKLLTKKPVTLYLPVSAIDEFKTTYPHLHDVFKIIPWHFKAKYVFGDISITPLPANHGIETAGFLINSAGSTLAYFPDTAGLPEATAQKLHGIDYFICDATFYGENWYPHSHMNVNQAIAVGREIDAGQTVLTHMSVHYSKPITTVELEKEVSKTPGVIVAREGMCINL